MTHVDRTLARILALDLKSDPQWSRVWSHMALYREYMRRVAIWGQEFGWEPSYGILSYVDLANVIQPALTLPEDVLAVLEKQPLGLRGRRYFINALKWAALEDSDETGRFSQLNPYELIFRIYERGGYVSGEHGFIEVTVHSFFAGNRKTSNILNYPPLDLSQQSLDGIDEQGNPNSS